MAYILDPTEYKITGKIPMQEKLIMKDNDLIKESGIAT